jgi:hypothetical protein
VDQAVFFRSEKGTLVVIVMHVDDLTIVTSSITLMAEVKDKLGKALKITDMGEIHWILGFSVQHDHVRRVISLGQLFYIDSILQRYGFENLRPLSMPMDPHVHLTSAQSPQTQEEFAAMRDVPYREAVGSLMYVSLGTRPDITYAVSIISKFNQNPGRTHWNAVKCVFAYLAGTKDLRLTFGGKECELQGYSDADGSMHEE